MDRLTTWNGEKYILPQGRTSEGESYWRIIADKLAQFENNEPGKKEMRYGFSDIVVPIETKNVARLVRIFNSNCEDVARYWLTEPEWAERFETKKSWHWMFQDLDGLATAMFYMNMLPDAEYTHHTYIYDFIKAEVDRRKGVSE